MKRTHSLIAGVVAGVALAVAAATYAQPYGGMGYGHGPGMGMGWARSWANGRVRSCGDGRCTPERPEGATEDHRSPGRRVAGLRRRGETASGKHAGHASPDAGERWNGSGANGPARDGDAATRRRDGDDGQRVRCVVCGTDARPEGDRRSTRRLDGPSWDGIWSACRLNDAGVGIRRPAQDARLGTVRKRLPLPAQKPLSPFSPQQRLRSPGCALRATNWRSDRYARPFRVVFVAFSPAASEGTFRLANVVYRVNCVTPSTRSRTPSTRHASSLHSTLDARAIARKLSTKQSAIDAHRSVSGDQTPPGPPNSGGEAVAISGRPGEVRPTAPSG